MGRCFRCVGAVPLLGVLGVLGVAPAFGQLTAAFTYQGELRSGGVPAVGPHDMRFRLYNVAAGGGPLAGTLCVDNMNLVDGRFTVSLDFGSVYGTAQRFLEIDVRADTGLGCGNPTGYTTLSPRQALTTIPQAWFALDADRLDGMDSSAFLTEVPVPLTLSGSLAGPLVHVVSTSSTVGAVGLQVDTSVSALSTAIRATTASGAGAAVSGAATAAGGSAIGGSFSTSCSSGVGVLGVSTASSGNGIGGEFRVQSPSGTAVLARALSGGGTAGVFQGGGMGLFASASDFTGPSVAGQFVCDSAGGHAGLFSNGGTGGQVEICGPSGALVTDGFVKREYTAGAPSCAIPIAYGSVAADGSVSSGTGNFAAARQGAGVYDVTVNGHTYSNTAYVVTITPVSNGPRMTAVADPGAAFRVNVWNQAGTLTDTPFHFTIWTGNP